MGVSPRRELRERLGTSSPVLDFLRSDSCIRLVLHTFRQLCTSNDSGTPSGCERFRSGGIRILPG